VQMLLVAFSRRMCCSRAISGPDPRQIGDMLGILGGATLEALIDWAVPGDPYHRAARAVPGQERT
jgi:hypothetical protein